MIAPLAEIFLLIDFGLVGLLPLLFFRRDGRFNAKWWLTAAPFFLCALLLALALAGALRPWVDPASTAAQVLALVATVLAAASIGLMALAVGSHDQGVSLWHQAAIPGVLVKNKAYRLVRHPFYLAFMFAFSGICLLLPHPLVWAIAAYGFVSMHVTARAEERQLLASPLGAEYGDYMAHTGRFLPRWRGRA